MSDTAPTPPASTAPAKKRGKLWRFVKWVFGLGFVGGLVGLLIAGVLIFSWTRNLPDLEAIKDYRPAEMTRVHAGDGKLIAEYATEHRIFVPIESIPKELHYAFVATEDQRFYTHNGWDPIGLTRAAIMAIPSKLQGKRIGGTSTLTQQVAKNFIVGNDYSIKRKVREIAIARRIEKALTKDQILELYLNEIYFGRRSYGIAAASLNYFGKPMDQLTVGEMSYMALLPKGPNNYRLDNPRTLERAMNRRQYVLGRMVEDGYITQAVADEAKVEPLVANERLEGEEYLAAEYFVEEARRELFAMYAEDEETARENADKDGERDTVDQYVYSGGLSVRTTLDTTMQKSARRALRQGLEDFDKRHGYRGPIGSVDVSADWTESVQAVEVPRDLGDWHKAVVLKATSKSADLGLLETVEVEGENGEPPTEQIKQIKGTLAFEDMKWARKDVADSPNIGAALKGVTDVLKKGDVILVSAKKKDGTYALQQVPVVNGGLIAMDAHTGRVLALVGGYSFNQSQFNRATQAKRQPGSAFKPFVYLAALENGYTPASQILDAPFVIERDQEDCVVDGGEVQDEGTDAESIVESGLEIDLEDDLAPCLYKPENYSDKFYGMSTMRLGIEKSRNAMTVRLANDMGMRPVIDIGKRTGIYDDVRSELAWSLGAGETTVMRLAGGYASIVNGGKYVEPTIIDRVQDSSGKTIFKADTRECLECNVESFNGQTPPQLLDARTQVIDPVAAYQMTSMLEGTVQRGTGAGLKQLGRPLGGKTGTTNDEIDAWFMGFTPDMVIGVYVGMDSPEPMDETGAKAALPIWRSFARDALKNEPIVPFRIPEGVVLAPVDATSGEASFIGAPNAILEAFRPGTEPQLGASTASINSGGTNSFIAGFGGPSAPDGPDDNASIDDLLIGDLGGDDEETPPAKQPAPTPEQPAEDVLEDGLY